MTKTIIAKNVRRLRLARQLSQRTLADRAGISQSYVHQVEHAAGNLTIDVLDELAAALGVSTRSLVTETK